jgi:hypothetical protein
VRITSAEWKGGRPFDGVLLASLALLAHGIAFVILSIAIGRPGAPLTLRPRVASAAQPEHLRYVVPAIPVPAVRHRAIGPLKPQPRVTAGIPRGAPVRPRTDSGAHVAAGLAASAPAVAPTAGFLVTPLPTDPRLLVAPGSANNGADTRLYAVNASIAFGVRAVNDSIARKQRGWTVGDSTHRLGIAPCGIEVWVVCIPFGVGSMPNPATSQTGIDLTRAATEAEVRAAIARVRAKDSTSRDGAQEPAGP